MNNYQKEVRELYKENRPITVEETKDKLEQTKLNLGPKEEFFFICPICLRLAYVREKNLKVCMDCYIPLVVRGTCEKCGRILLKENATKKCLNRSFCRTETTKA